MENLTENFTKINIGDGFMLLKDKELLQEEYYEVYLTDGSAKKKFSTVGEAYASGEGAIKAGVPENFIRIMKFDANNKPLWEVPCEHQSGTWFSVDEAIEEFQEAGITEEMIEKEAEQWKIWKK